MKTVLVLLCLLCVAGYAAAAEGIVSEHTDSSYLDEEEDLFFENINSESGETLPVVKKNGFSSYSFKDIAAGFLSVFSDTKNLDDCVMESKLSYSQFQNAVDSFEQKDSALVIDGLQQLGDGLKIILNSLKSCKSAVGEIQRLQAAIGAFRNPIQMISHVSTHIRMNGVTILHDVEFAIVSFKLEQWFVFGKTLGRICSLVLDGYSKEIEISKDVTSPASTAVLEVFVGVAIGFFESAIPDLETCITEPEVVLSDFMQAVTLLEKDDVNDIIAGVKQLGVTLRAVVIALKACKATVLEIEKLEAAVASLTTPLSIIVHIGKDIIVNGIQIIKDIIDAIKQYRDKSWLAFGKDLGAILEKTFIGYTMEWKAVDGASSRLLDVQCDSSGHYSCPPSSTCCPLASSGYSCCGVSNAVCCSDHIHCCPSDYPICAVAEGECRANMNNSYMKVPIVKKFGLTDTKADVVNSLKGLLMGFIKGSIPDLFSCIKDSDSTIVLFKQAVDMLKSKESAHVKKGLHLLGESLKSLLTAIKDCKGAESEIVRLVNTLKSFSNPSSFLFHVLKDLIVNGINIFKEIYAAVEAYDHKSWYDFGFNIGEALAQLLVGDYLSALSPAVICKCLFGSADVQYGTCWINKQVYENVRRDLAVSNKCNISVGVNNNGINECVCKFATGSAIGACYKAGGSYSLISAKVTKVDARGVLGCRVVDYEAKAFTKKLANTMVNSLHAVVCSQSGNDQQTCPEGSTCCLSPDNVTYTCCPSANAVCCPDKIHCCPEAFNVCDTEHGRCSAKMSAYTTYAGASIPMKKKLSSKRRAIIPVSRDFRKAISMVFDVMEKNTPSFTTCLESVFLVGPGMSVPPTAESDTVTGLHSAIASVIAALRICNSDTSGNAVILFDRLADALEKRPVEPSLSWWQSMLQRVPVVSKWTASYWITKQTNSKDCSCVILPHRKAYLCQGSDESRWLSTEPKTRTGNHVCQVL